VAERVTVSVIVPVFDTERFVAAALDSIVAQTRPADEVIVVDDGSTDSSAAIADEYASRHPELRVLRQANGGPGAARNAGIEAATGEFLAFHDADDEMVPDRLSVQLECFARRADLDVVVGAEDPMIEAGAAPGVEAMTRARPGWRGHEHALHLMSMMARATVFDRVGRFDPSYRMAEDTEWFARAFAAHASILFLDDVLTRRRIHDTNASHHRDASRAALFRMLRERRRAGGA
jgi:glycosyltransferase involved in cell wall biosynthesis